MASVLGLWHEHGLTGRVDSSGWVWRSVSAAFAVEFGFCIPSIDLRPKSSNSVKLHIIRLN